MNFHFSGGLVKTTCLDAGGEPLDYVDGGSVVHLFTNVGTPGRHPDHEVGTLCGLYCGRGKMPDFQVPQAPAIWCPKCRKSRHAPSTLPDPLVFLACSEVQPVCEPTEDTP